MVAPDKALHAGGSAAMTVAIYGAISQFTRSVWVRSIAAGTLVAVAGLAKEVFDVSRGGQADLLDLGADAAGIGAGLLLALAFETAFFALREQNAARADGDASQVVRLENAPTPVWTPPEQSLSFQAVSRPGVPAWSPPCFRF